MCDAFFANREGILGLVGYVGVWLLSEEIGRYCFLPKQQHLDRDNQGIKLSALRQRRLLHTTILLWILLCALTMGLQLPISRRSSNLPFVLWALAHNSTILCSIHFVVECSTSGKSPPTIPRLLCAVNRHGLVVFLLSNILTGSVNLTMDTLNATHKIAVRC